MLVPYLNNPSEEAIFESNRIKELHDTMKLQNEEVVPKTLNTVTEQTSSRGSHPLSTCTKFSKKLTFLTS